MADVTKSIGTASRDYSTVTAWAADLDNDTPYDAGDNAIGEAYDDSDFSDSALNISGGTTLGLTGWVLTAASGEEHDGTAFNGVVNDGSGGSFAFQADTNTLLKEISLWIINGWGAGVSDKNCLIVSGTNSNSRVRRCILDPGQSPAQSEVDGIQFGRAGNEVTNNIILNTANASNDSGDEGSIRLQFDSTQTEISNNTLYNCRNWGIDASSQTGDCYNNLVIGTAGSGTPLDYANTGTLTNFATNGSGDTSGNSGLQSLTAGNQFVSTTAGSEDLHLKSGADAIDAGTDLGTTEPFGSVDIDGRDRDAQGDTWDLGAHEFVPVITELLQSTLEITHYKEFSG